MLLDTKQRGDVFSPADSNQTLLTNRHGCGPMPRGCDLKRAAYRLPELKEKRDTVDGYLIDHAIDLIASQMFPSWGKGKAYSALPLYIPKNRSSFFVRRLKIVDKSVRVVRRPAPQPFDKASYRLAAKQLAKARYRLLDVLLAGKLRARLRHANGLTTTVSVSQLRSRPFRHLTNIGGKPAIFEGRATVLPLLLDRDEFDRILPLISGPKETFRQFVRRSEPDARKLREAARIISDLAIESGVVVNKDMVLGLRQQLAMGKVSEDTFRKDVWRAISGKAKKMVKHTIAEREAAGRLEPKILEELRKHFGMPVRGGN